jgi:hypothetical protein
MKTRFLILKLIQQDIKTINGIANKLQKDKKTIREHLQRLQRDQLITPKPHKITEQGKKELLNATTTNTNNKPTNPAYDIVRLHKLWIKLGTTNIIPTGKKNIMNNSWFIDQKQPDHNLRTFNNGTLLISPKAFWGYTYKECYTQLTQWLQQWHNNQPQYPFQPTILTGEVAYINEYNTRKEKIIKTKIKVYDNDGKLSLIIDNSYTDPEIDLVHPTKHPNHAQELEHNYKKIITGENRQIYQDIKNLKEDNQQITELLKAQNETLKQTLTQNQIIIKQITQLGGFKK